MVSRRLARPTAGRCSGRPVVAVARKRPASVAHGRHGTRACQGYRAPAVVPSRLAPRWLLTASVAATLVAGACAGGGNGVTAPSSPAAAHHATTTASTTATLDPGEPTKAAASYGVGSHTLHLVDTSRPTKASPTRNIPASTSRKLDVLVLYPIADTAGGATPVPDAPVADGRFPLLEFSHGVTASGPVYAPFLAPIGASRLRHRRADVPATSGAGAGGRTLSDYVNQPADVSFVLDNIPGARHEGAG